MELLLVLGMVFLFGMVALSAAAQRQAPPAPVIVFRAEPLDRPEAGGGAGLVIFVLVVVIALVVL